MNIPFIDNQNISYKLVEHQHYSLYSCIAYALDMDIKTLFCSGN